jgi:mono/diheme cytochrome c family protein
MSEHGIRNEQTEPGAAQPVATGRQSRRSGEVSTFTWIAGFVAGGLAIYLMVLAYMIGYDEGKRHAGKAPAATRVASRSTPAAGGAEVAGRELFKSTCGSCHTLNAAGTSAQVGPNLDQLKPSEERVLAAIKNGGTGQGIMPVNIYTGKKAQQVAEFVSTAAGR